jgi:putative oxidoreductase
MNGFLENKYVILAARIVVGAVFVVASIDKIASPDAFAANVLAYGILPYPLVNLFAVVVPWIELVCGVFLVSGVLVRSTSAMLSFLLACFVAAMIAALLQELKIDCGCFGKEHATPVSWWRVGEDAGLMLLSVYLFFFPYPRFSVENLFAAFRPPHDETPE